MQLIYDVALQMSSILLEEDLYWEIVRLIQTEFGYYNVDIYTIDDERQFAVCRAAWDPAGPRRDLVGWSLRVRDQGIIGWVAWSGEPLLVADVEREPRYYLDARFASTRSELTVPIKSGNRTIGVLNVLDNRLGAFDTDDLMLLETLARQIAIAIENAVLYEEVLRSRSALQQQARDLDAAIERAAQLQEEDRRRIALALHDGVAQLLVGAKFELETVRLAKPPLPTHIDEQLQLVCRVLGDHSEELREVIFDLYPPELEEVGLVPTIERYLATFRRLSGLECSFKVFGKHVRLPVDVELAAYRIVQESLTNVFKHGGGASPKVTLRFGEQLIRITIRDDGPGFDPGVAGQNRPTFGLGSMRRRARAVGAELTIQSAPNQGTTVLLTFRPRGGADD